MTCSPKTMIKIGGGILLVLGVGYAIFPAFRTVIASLAPFALFALCPLSMLFCMRGMGKQNPECAVKKRKGT